MATNNIEKFIVYGKQGDKIELTLGNLLTKKCDMPRFEVVEVKKSHSIIAKDTTCTISFTTMSCKVILGIKDCGDLDISNHQRLIDWLFNVSQFHMLYPYTTEYKNNNED